MCRAQRSAAEQLALSRLLCDSMNTFLSAHAVTMNGEPLVMTKGETELELIPFVEGGELMMLWQKHRESLGEAVEITTSESHLLPCRDSRIWIHALCCL